MATELRRLRAITNRATRTPIIRTTRLSHTMIRMQVMAMSDTQVAIPKVEMDTMMNRTFERKASALVDRTN